MILKTRHRGDRELRSAWPDYTKPSRASVWNSSGQRVDVSTATGLPAVGAAFRLGFGVRGHDRRGVYVRWLDYDRTHAGWCWRKRL